MASNIEIKAYARDFARKENLAKTIATQAPMEIVQEDHFFNCPNGRLKLRVFDAERAELIFYQRENSASTKQSNYLIAEVTRPEMMRQTLAAALGQGVTVKKRRTLYMKGQTRIHLDRVENLGDFVELEVVLREGQQAQEGHAIAAEIMRELEIIQADLIDCAYADMLAKK